MTQHEPGSSPEHGDRYGRTLRLIPTIGYILAPLIVVGLWAYGMATEDVTGELRDDRFWRLLLITFVISAPLAVLLGLFDGAARVAGRQRDRALISIALVALSLFWISFVGSFSLEGLYGQLPGRTSSVTYLGALAGMELALLAEWLTAIAISLLARLLARRR